MRTSTQMTVVVTIEHERGVDAAAAVQRMLDKDIEYAISAELPAGCLVRTVKIGTVMHEAPYTLVEVAADNTARIVAGCALAGGGAL